MPLDKQFFIKKIEKVTEEAMVKEAAAPTKGGWDPIFRKRIESKMQVTRAWKDTVQRIIEKASFFGHDLSAEFVAKELDE